MGIDLKYGKVTLESSSIEEDEPVVVFRAKDKILPKLLAYYHLFCTEKSPRGHLNLIMDARANIVRWQSQNWNKVKDPD